MTSNWKEYKLKNILAEKGYIRGPFGSALKRGELKNTGIPVYEQQHAIYNNRNFRFFIDEKKYEELHRFSTETNDLIISCSGTVGKVTIVKESDPKGIISQALLILRANTEIALPVYLKYFFESTEGYNSIISRSSGSVQINIAKREVIENIPIKLPDLKTQRKIAKVLSAIDDKIELNNSINNNLEQQAQAIFNNKFVNIESIPNNWESANLSTIADYLNGLAMQKFRPNNDEIGIPVLKIKELRQGFCDNQSDLCSPNIKSEYLIKDGDVIFSWSGTLYLDLWCSGLCGLNQHLFKVTSEKFDKWFFYFWTKYHLNKFIAIAADKATTMGHIKREDLDKSEVIIPDEKTYFQLNSILTPMLELIIKNKVKNRQLIQLRDTLLPKLMSGEIDVSNIEIDEILGNISSDKLSFSEVQ